MRAGYLLRRCVLLDISMNGPALDSLQRLFRERLQAVQNDQATAPLEAFVIGTPRAAALTRIGIYGAAYRLRLIDTLGKDYPVLLALVGKPEFDRMAEGYIAAYPSTTPNLRWFGRHLSTYLVEAGEGPRRPVLAELAQFEWKQGEAFDAPNASVLTVEEVAAVPPASWPGMRLLLQPSIRRLDLRWNVGEIVNAHAHDRKRAAARQNAKSMPWLMWRDAMFDIRWRSMAHDEKAAFDAAADDRSFADLCELLCDFMAPEKAPMQAASLLKRWVVDGLITGLELAD